MTNFLCFCFVWGFTARVLLTTFYPVERQFLSERQDRLWRFFYWTEFSGLEMFSFLLQMRECSDEFVIFENLFPLRLRTHVVWDVHVGSFCDIIFLKTAMLWHRLNQVAELPCWDVWLHVVQFLEVVLRVFELDLLWQCLKPVSIGVYENLRPSCALVLHKIILIICNKFKKGNPKHSKKRKSIDILYVCHYEEKHNIYHFHVCSIFK